MFTLTDDKVPSIPMKMKEMKKKEKNKQKRK